ncbi:MAG: hypothetical protein DRQ61_03740 [Gammaproteobacteria bacterium]|nr:MAG: hypothetical protein DRQ56_10485 [Gammaproteobacteria bacterium]RLA23481.1 MAG: hypothetical protein DRQ61_03740 [Gammaproteobacteria bacterium]
MKLNKFSVLNGLFISTSLLIISPSILAYHGVASIDLKGLLDAAWMQSGAASVFEQRKQALVDKSEISRQFFPSSAEVGASFDSDELFKDEGKREYALQIETPIWLPGQQKALSSEVGAEMSLLVAEEVAQRWQLAGLVREDYWAVMIARNDVKLAARKLEISEKLVANVNKRVQAGELAEIDLLLSKQKKLATESELLSANQLLAKAQLVFNGLAGRDAPEDWLSETEQSIPLEDHPMLVFISKQLTLNQAGIEKIRSKKREAPRLGLGLKRERDYREEDYQNSVGIEFILPLENNVINKSDFAHSQAEKAAIEARYFREKYKLEKSIELAKLAVIHAEKSYEIAERLKVLAVKHFRLMQNAFNIGEVGLRELLLVQNDSDRAVESSAQQKVEVASAISRFNQEQGALL